MTQFGMWFFMSTLGLCIAYRQFKKSGFNPFKKYSKRQKNMFMKAEKLQDKENKL